MMVHLLLVRHGETDLNAAGRYQGQRADSTLTERGRRQVAAAAAALRGRTIHAAYNSDLRRARETAAIIGDGQTYGWTETALLREIDFGLWDGRTLEEIRQQDPAGRRAWEENPLLNAPPEGENLQNLAARMTRFVDEVLVSQAEQTVLVVSHGGPLRVLIANALGLPPTAYKRFFLDPGSISELYLNPAGNVLTLLNYHHDVDGVAADA